MKLTKKRILITAGEPASISSEITVKAIEKLNNQITLETFSIKIPENTTSSQNKPKSKP